MVASLRLVAVVFAAAACDANVPRDEVEVYVEAKLESMWGITAPVHCHPMVRKPMPGDTFTCDMTHRAETYLIRVRIDEANETFISVVGSESVLLPLSLLESTSGLRLECADGRHVRLAARKPSYCKVIGSSDGLRIMLDNIKTGTWSCRRVSPEAPPIRLPDDQLGQRHHGPDGRNAIAKWPAIAHDRREWLAS